MATRLSEVDRGRTWEVAAEAVKASNSAEGFSGEDSNLMIKLESNKSSRMMNFNVESFDLAGLFARLRRSLTARSIAKSLR